MADKKALNATFFAFQRRERGGVLLGATLAYALIAIVLAGAFIALNWQAVIDYVNWSVSVSQSGASTDPSNPFGGMMPPQSVLALGGWYVLFLIFFYLLLAAYEAACLRWMIHGETKGLFGLALDADTLRVYFGYWLWFVLFMAVYLICVFAIVGTIAGAAVSSPNAGPEALGAMAPIVALIVLGVILLVIYFGVRFSPAAATSIAKRRFAFFDAWTVTKGRFWALFGAFVLLWLMYFVGIIVLTAVAGFAMTAGMVGQIPNGQEPATPQEAMAMFAQPGLWVPLAIIYGVMIVGAFMFYVALFGVNARAAIAALEEGKITTTAV